MPTEQRYPLELDLSRAHCLIAGLGRVGQRKLDRILRFAPRRISVFDPHADAAPLASAQDNADRAVPVVLIRRKVTAEDLDDADIVFACTADAEENRRIASLCAEKKILCNCVSDPKAGTVSLPACIDTTALTLTLSTHGASPAFARKWRRELEAWAAGKTAVLCVMARLRPLVLSLGRPSEDNAQLFRTLAESPLETLLASSDLDSAAHLLRDILPPDLHEKLPELLHDVT